MTPRPADVKLASLEPPAFSASEQAVGPYLRAVRRHWKFVVAVTLITVAAAIATALRSGRAYAATSTILVSPLSQSDTNFIGIGVVSDSGDPARTVQTATALINSADAAAATAKLVGHGYTTDTVQKGVSVTPLGQSDVVSITATGPTPQLARALASVFAQQAVRVRGVVVQRNIAAALATLESRVAAVPRSSTAATSALTDLNTRIGELSAAQSSGRDPTLQVDQLAQLPTTPTGASRTLIALLGLLGGFALGSVGALGLEFFSRPVRDEEEITSIFPAPVLASIPRVRHGRSTPLSPWLLPPAAFEQVRLLRVQLDLGIGAPVIMVTSAGAGDGKTTLVASLAAAYGENGQTVVVMDLDLRRQNLSKVLGIGLDELSGSESMTHSGLRSAITAVPRMENVKLLHFPGASASDVDTVLDRLPLLLTQAQRTAGVVILDTAPIGEVSEALRVVPMAEAVLFVARPRFTDRKRLALARDLLVRAGARIAGIVLVQTALNRNPSGYYDYAAKQGNGVPGAKHGNVAASVTHRMPERGAPPREPTPS